jgi:AAA ATPase domain
MDIIRFSIENFRSFKDRQEVTLSARILIVTGRNNSGKSNILRAAALIYNQFENHNVIQPLYDFFDQNLGAFHFSVFGSTQLPSIAALRDSSAAFRRCFQSIAKIEVPYLVDQSKTSLDEKKFSGMLDSIIPYGQDTTISQELAGSWSNDRNHNLVNIIRGLDIRKDLLFGTVYVPSFRHITQPGTVLQSYNQMRLPGQTISPENIVTTLQAFDRPPIGHLQEKEKLRRIEEFLSHCLEEKVGIEVASDRSAIYVSMAGATRDLRALGTGIEQLLIIGTASVGFENRIVLFGGAGSTPASSRATTNAGPFQNSYNKQIHYHDPLRSSSRQR